MTTAQDQDGDHFAGRPAISQPRKDTRTMSNEYFVARDDGETTGPFVDADAALLWAVSTLADDPDDNNIFTGRAVSLEMWYGRMVERHTTRSSEVYGDWLSQAKALIKSVDWILYGVEFVVDSDNASGFQGVTNFLSSAEMLHSPNDEVHAMGLTEAMANAAIPGFTFNPQTGEYVKE